VIAEGGKVSDETRLWSCIAIVLTGYAWSILVRTYALRADDDSPIVGRLSNVGPPIGMVVGFLVLYGGSR
jgi:hypothetical protein